MQNLCGHLVPVKQRQLLLSVFEELVSLHVIPDGLDDAATRALRESCHLLQLLLHLYDSGCMQGVVTVLQNEFWE